VHDYGNKYEKMNNMKYRVYVEGGWEAV